MTDSSQVVAAADVVVYNSLTRRKEPFASIEPGRIGMYVCGVTVYDDAHIGHGMSSIIFDVIRRYFLHLGYDVRYAQNFTDVDDRIIKRAADEGIEPSVLTERLISDWNRETAALNILPATVAPRATQEIPGIIGMISGLIEGDHAYESNGDVYFSVRSFPEYGKLSHRDIDGLRAGARIDVNEQKRDPLDFVLWKSAKPGEPSWPSPWSEGRPGWHIECSAMCSHHLNGVVDIHGGGRDLIFPHHENEIAQSEAFSNVSPFARYWMHNGMLQLNGEKMSKSIGNVVPLREIIEKRRSAAFRLQVLQTHYRSPLNFTYQGLEAAESGLSRLRSALDSDPATDQRVVHVTATALENTATEAETRFHDAMRDDFDTPVAIAAIFDLGRAINRAKRELGATPELSAAQQTLRELTGILGLDLSPVEVAPSLEATPFIDLLIGVRKDLRTTRQFAIADAIRDGLLEQGIALEDTPEGTIWKSIERN
ncbi:MAG: Cysteinyl-tRNA synthetase [uncultured Thermomicrobiales bacterium]|uniref:Cysteine--tRNA ligase n=1 Tax=uncultured Thermomicrobiales bacterium TaxID=1645740 RepID=A0A6J4U4G6_9BACT|nr:MAG: Cysteinyl-tRNA synthetase [uncultured Thermomicrobiales bacterium]